MEDVTVLYGVFLIIVLVVIGIGRLVLFYFELRRYAEERAELKRLMREQMYSKDDDSNTWVLLLIMEIINS